MTKIGYAAVKLIHNSQGISQAGGAIGINLSLETDRRPDDP